jgi:putative ABC transport system permease protein
MNLFSTFRLAISRIIVAKTRSLLTMLGVVIGVAAIVALTAVSQGATVGINKSLASLGTNQISVSALTPEALSESDAIKIASLDRVKSLYTQVSGRGTASANGSEIAINLSGVSANYAPIAMPEVAVGSFLSSSPDVQGARNVVLSARAAATLGLEANDIGGPIRINGVEFTLVGVLDDALTFGGGTRAYVSLETARTLFSQYPYLQTITVQAETRADVDWVLYQTDQLLRSSYGLPEDDESQFQITNQANLLSTVNTISVTLSLLLSGIASISLIVGGIGIMNIMLVSVRERTREVGIRRAIGAKRSQILVQFLIEAVVLSIAGGIVGIILGQIAAFFLAIVGGWDFTIDLNVILLALGFSSLVGIVFGVWPARTASRLQPVDALRFE